MTKIKTAEDRLSELPDETIITSAMVLAANHEEVIDLRARVAELEKENQGLRYFVCVKTTRSPYLDDGEMQDNTDHPCIDFKRDTVEQICEAWRMRLATKLAIEPQGDKP